SVNGNTLIYDAEERQTKVTEPPGLGGATETYYYDGAGQRVEKSGPSGLTVYVYDAFGQLAAEYSGSSAVNPPCTTCYLSYDHLGSLRLVTDANANVIARHDYVPFGEEILAGYAGRNSQFGASDGLSQRLTGQARDTESGEDFFNARYFTAPLQRFNSPDPGNAGADVTNPQSWNGYGYVLGNPLALVDPSGLDSIGWRMPPVTVTCGIDCLDFGSGGGGGNPSPPRLLGLDPGSGFQNSLALHTL